jgi:hypothetical protein
MLQQKMKNVKEYSFHPYISSLFLKFKYSILY